MKNSVGKDSETLMRVFQCFFLCVCMCARVSVLQKEISTCIGREYNVGSLPVVTESISATDKCTFRLK